MLVTVLATSNFRLILYTNIDIIGQQSQHRVFLAIGNLRALAGMVPPYHRSGSISLSFWTHLPSFVPNTWATSVP